MQGVSGAAGSRGDFRKPPGSAADLQGFCAWTSQACCAPSHTDPTSHAQKVASARTSDSSNSPYSFNNAPCPAVSHSEPSSASGTSDRSTGETRLMLFACAFTITFAERVRLRFTTIAYLSSVSPANSPSITAVGDLIDVTSFPGSPGTPSAGNGAEK